MAALVRKNKNEFKNRETQDLELLKKYYPEVWQKLSEHGETEQDSSER